MSRVRQDADTLHVGEAVLRLYDRLVAAAETTEQDSEPLGGVRLSADAWGKRTMIGFLCLLWFIVRHPILTCDALFDTHDTSF